jgi:glycosyltransferase involved in cell wall biosynthesis
MRVMRVTYVLAHPTLGGGTKVIAQHAALLRQAGVDVTLIAQGPRPEWLPFDGRYIDRDLDADAAVAATAASASDAGVGLGGGRGLASQDLVIATFWTTVETALRLEIGPVAHFCQGYEGALDYLRADWPRIDAVYARDLPTFTVTPHLADLLARRFGRACRVTVPPLDPRFHPAAGRPLGPVGLGALDALRPLRDSQPRSTAPNAFGLPGPAEPSELPGSHSIQSMQPRREPWIAIPGVFEAGVKDVPTALRAVQRIRIGGGCGGSCRVLRFSTLPQSAAERDLLVAEQYLCGVPPREIAAVLRDCDLMLFTSRPEEGFGLPLLEAMASGVPVVASRIPSAEFITQGSAVPLVTPGDDIAFAEAARALLDDAPRWRDVRAQGIEAGRRFEAARVLPELLSAIEWAAAHASRVAHANDTPHCE